MSETLSCPWNFKASRGPSSGQEGLSQPYSPWNSLGGEAEGRGQVCVFPEKPGGAVKGVGRYGSYLGEENFPGPRTEEFGAGGRRVMGKLF